MVESFQIDPAVLGFEDEEDEEDERTEEEKKTTYSLEVEASTVFECDATACGNIRTDHGGPTWECQNCNRLFLQSDSPMTRRPKKKGDPWIVACTNNECNSIDTKMIGEEGCTVCRKSTTSKIDAIICPCANCEDEENAWVNVERF